MVVVHLSHDVIVLRLVVLYYSVQLLEAFNHVLVFVEAQSQCQLKVHAFVIFEEITTTSLGFLDLILFDEIIV